TDCWPLFVCWNHVIVTVPPPAPVEALVVNVKLLPFCVAVGVVIVTAGQPLFALTMTVAVWLSAGWHPPVTDTRTQYEVVDDGVTDTDELMALAIGFAVSP